MDGEQAAMSNVAGPSAIVGASMFHAVAAVDEQERERRAPMPGDDWRLTDDSDHAIFDARVEHGATKCRQRVHHPGLGIDDRWIVMLPTRLVLLRAAVVVDCEQDRRTVLRRRP